MMEDNIVNYWDIDLIFSIENKLNTDVLDLSMALEKMFQYPTDKLILKINDFSLSMPLSYCFSDLLDDFLNIITNIFENNEGNGVYGFSQNDFFDADWILNWKDDLIVIEFEWREINDDLDLKKLPSSIEISKKHFLNTWGQCFKRLLTVIEVSFLEDKTEYNLIYNLFGTSWGSVVK